MPFYRFEELEAHSLTPHLSSARGPVIEGTYLNFCLVRKEPGTGSEPHYHPNELLIFPLSGAIDALIGTDRTVLKPGMFAQVPRYALHSMKATTSGPLEYLYMKDKTWTVVGLAADEAVPEKAMTVEEVNRLYDSQSLPRANTQQASSAVMTRGSASFYRFIDGLDAPPSSTYRASCVEGTHLAFTFVDIPPEGVGNDEAPLRLFEMPRAAEGGERRSPYETFIYVIGGAVSASIDGEGKALGAGDIAHIPKDASYRLDYRKSAGLRLAMVCATPALQKRIDSMSPEEAAQARVHVGAN